MYPVISSACGQGKASIEVKNLFNHFNFKICSIISTSGLSDIPKVIEIIKVAIPQK